MAGTKLKDFNATIGNFQSDIEALRHKVEGYAKEFPTIGFEKASMKYKD
jgi:glycine hydroxymethyltransferase